MIPVTAYIEVYVVCLILGRLLTIFGDEWKYGDPCSVGVLRFNSAAKSARQYISCTKLSMVYKRGRVRGCHAA